MTSRIFDIAGQLDKIIIKQLHLENSINDLTRTTVNIATEMNVMRAETVAVAYALSRGVLDFAIDYSIYPKPNSAIFYVKSSDKILKVVITKDELIHVRGYEITSAKEYHCDKYNELLKLDENSRKIPTIEKAIRENGRLCES